MGSSWIRRMLPPYYKYAVFLLAGFELLFSCLVLSIAEAYYKAAALLLPIAYRIFDDTAENGTEGFNWDNSAREILEMYKHKMMIVWVVCTISVLFCMLVVIPQFFDFNDQKGNRSHLCLVRKQLGWILFGIQSVVVICQGIALVWAWIGCGEAVTLFHRLFDVSHKKGSVLSQFACSTDDHKEMCEQNVKMSFIEKWWMDAIVITFFAGHLVIFLLTPVFNRQLIKDGDAEETGKELLDA